MRHLRALACWVLLSVSGCSQSGPTWLQFDPTGEGGAVTQSDKIELKLMQAETSEIPGATARVFPPPADAPPLPGTTPADFCVTVAGYCPLAGQTPAGENCLCAATNGMYGGKTGAPPQTMTLRKMFEGSNANLSPP